MLTRSEIRAALLTEGEDQKDLFTEANQLRDEHFGRAVVLRGVVEITNVCRVNCEYCPMRRENLKMLDRFFLGAEDILARARHIRDAGIDVILLQGGETPSILPTLREVIPKLMRMWGGRVEVLLNLGNFSRHQYEELRELGATSYIIKHETSAPALFEAMRHEKLPERLDHMRTLLELGYRVGTGLISSLPGQTLEKTASGGQSRGLAAGANVLTINFTGDADINRYLIYGKERFVVRAEHVRIMLADGGFGVRGSVFLPQAAQ